jgi:hypothetical protein
MHHERVGIVGCGLMSAGIAEVATRAAAGLLGRKSGGFFRDDR